MNKTSAPSDGKGSPPNVETRLDHGDTPTEPSHGSLSSRTISVSVVKLSSITTETGTAPTGTDFLRFLNNRSQPKYGLILSRHEDTWKSVNLVFWHYPLKQVIMISTDQSSYLKSTLSDALLWPMYSLDVRARPHFFHVVPRGAIDLEDLGSWDHSWYCSSDWGNIESRQNTGYAGYIVLQHWRIQPLTVVALANPTRSLVNDAGDVRIRAEKVKVKAIYRTPFSKQELELLYLHAASDNINKKIVPTTHRNVAAAQRSVFKVRLSIR